MAPHTETRQVMIHSLKKLLLENRIGLSINYPEKDTFYHHNGKSSGQIDYIISTCKNILKKVEIMDMDPKNTSDHVPVIAQIKRKLVRRAYKPKTTIVKTKWEKCDLNTYQSTITDGVAQVLQNSNRNIEEDVVAMEEIIHTACDKTIPNYRKSTTRKPTGKSIWNNNIAEATKNAKIKYNQWRNARKSKGRENPLKSQLMVAKRLLRKAQTGICIAERMQNPANYRGITVTKIFTKIIQSILKSRVDIQIDQIQKPATKRIYRSNSYAICSFHSIRGHNRIQHK